MRKLNLGAGEDRRAGFTNIDWNPLAEPDVAHDLNSFPYPFSDGEFELIEANHILEHLDRPFEVMREMHRLLTPGGELIIRVPHFSRGFTHAEHSHGFDVTFPLYFRPNFTKSGYFGISFELISLKLHWLAFFHLLPYLGYGNFAIVLLKLANAAVSSIANLSPNFCSRIWCFWVGGFDEIEFRFRKPFEHSTQSADVGTAAAFATSWNNLPIGSVYTDDQFVDWLGPLKADDVRDKSVLELGCGNGSLMEHMLGWQPRELVGVDLGESVASARANLKRSGADNWRIEQGDMVSYDSAGFDLVYCIGVLHHLSKPQAGFSSVIRNVVPGGAFHCWVYAREGNWVIINLVDPLRRLTAKLPWRLTKYLVATPLAFLYMLYAKAIALAAPGGWIDRLPLAAYSRWIAKREFAFFRHVAFDQLVTPQTAYINKDEIESWLASNPRIDQSSTYLIFRNGNSWKFGGRVK